MPISPEDAQDLLEMLRPYFANINDETRDMFALEISRSPYSMATMADAVREVIQTVKASHIRPAHLFEAARVIHAYDARKRMVEEAERRFKELPESTETDPVMPAAAWGVMEWVRESTVRGDDGALHAPSDAQVQAKFREVVARIRKEGILEGPTSVREFLSGLEK